MANKEALRELQTRLADRLQQARSQERVKSWLAVESGARGFLFPLSEAGEIFPMSFMAAVPHSQPWFMGVANLRGHLHGVVDLSGFLGIKVASRGEASREQARLIAFSGSLDINCALLVDRLAGLRNAGQLQVEAANNGQALPAFVGQRFRDEAGRVWQELRLSALAQDEAFLKIVG